MATVLVAAQFSDLGAEVVLTFDAPTDRGATILGVTPGDFSCARLFQSMRSDPQFADFAANGDRCRWTSDLSMHVTLNAANANRTTMAQPLVHRTPLFSEGAVRPKGSGWPLSVALPASMDGGSVLIWAATAPVVPSRPTISAPRRATGGCTTISLDATVAAGSAGRPWLEVKWGINGVLNVDASMLNAAWLALDRANQEKLTFATIASLSAGVGGATAVYRISLGVRNWHSPKWSEFSSVEIAVGDPALPTLSIAGPSSIAVVRSALLRVDATVVVPTCVSGNAVNVAKVSWSITPQGGMPVVVGTASEDLVLPPNTLGAVGTVHVLTLAVTLSNGGANEASITVTTLAQPLIILVKGGERRAADVSQPLRLDASPSYDPDNTASELEVTWGCGSSFDCDLSAVALAKRGRVSRAVLTELTAGTIFAKALRANGVSVGGDGVLATVQLNATLRVAPPNSEIDARRSMTVVWIDLVDNSASLVVPLLKLGVPTQTSSARSLSAISITSKVNPSAKLSLAGALTAESARALENATLHFAWRVGPVAAVGDRLSAHDDSEDLAAAAFASRSDRPTIVLLPNSLVAGVTYAFELRCTNGDGGVGPVGIAATTMVVNEAPRGGVLSAVPASGVAGETLFALRTSAWVDDASDLPLRWTFYAAAVDGNGDGDSTTLQTLGALSLASTIADIVFSSGDPKNGHQLALSVRATDQFGATTALSAAATAHVTVTDPVIVVGTTIDEYLHSRFTEGGLDGDVSAVARQVVAAAILSNSAAVKGSDETQKALRAEMTSALTTALARYHRKGELAEDGSGGATTEVVEQLAFAAQQTVGDDGSALSVSSRLEAVALLLNLSAACTAPAAAVGSGSSAASDAGATATTGVAVMTPKSAKSIVSAFSSMIVPAGTKDAVRDGVKGVVDALAAGLEVGEAPAVVVSPFITLSSQRQLLSDLGPGALQSSPFELLGVPPEPTSQGTEAATVHSATFTLDPNSDTVAERGAPDAFVPTSNVASLRIVASDGSALFGTASHSAVSTVALAYNSSTSDAGAAASCAYWDTALGEWRSSGTVAVCVRGGAGATVVCATSHLTDFGARLQKEATPEVHLVDPVRDAPLLLTYDHTNITVPILLFGFNLAMIALCGVGWIIDRYVRHVEVERDAFGWTRRHAGRAAGPHDFHWEKEFREESIVCGTCCGLTDREGKRQCRLPLPFDGGDLNGWSIYRLGCGIDKSCCGFVSGGGRLCALVRRVISEHTVLSIVFATPPFHPVTRPMRATLLWATLATGFTVEALLWAKDDSRLEQKLRVAIIAMVCMAPPSIAFNWLFRRVNEFRQHRIAWDMKTGRYHSLLYIFSPQHIMTYVLRWFKKKARGVHAAEVAKVHSFKMDFRRGAATVQVAKEALNIVDNEPTPKRGSDAGSNQRTSNISRRESDHLDSMLAAGRRRNLHSAGDVEMCEIDIGGTTKAHAFMMDDVEYATKASRASPADGEYTAHTFAEQAVGDSIGARARRRDSTPGDLKADLAEEERLADAHRLHERSLQQRNSNARVAARLAELRAGKEARGYEEAAEVQQGGTPGESAAREQAIADSIWAHAKRSGSARGSGEAEGGDDDEAAVEASHAEPAMFPTPSAPPPPTKKERRQRAAVRGAARGQSAPQGRRLTNFTAGSHAEPAMFPTTTAPPLPTKKKRRQGAPARGEGGEEQRHGAQTLNDLKAQLVGEERLADAQRQREKSLQRRSSNARVQARLAELRADKEVGAATAQLPSAAARPKTTKNVAQKHNTARVRRSTSGIDEHSPVFSIMFPSPDHVDDARKREPTAANAAREAPRRALQLRGTASADAARRRRSANFDEGSHVSPFMFPSLGAAVQNTASTSVPASWRRSRDSATDMEIDDADGLIDGAMETPVGQKQRHASLISEYRRSMQSTASSHTLMTIAVEDHRRLELNSATSAAGSVAASPAVAFDHQPSQMRPQRRQQGIDRARSQRIDHAVLQRVNANACCWGLDGRADRCTSSSRGRRALSGYKACRAAGPLLLRCALPFARVGALLGALVLLAFAVALAVFATFVTFEPGYEGGVFVLGMAGAVLSAFVALMCARAGWNGTHADRLSGVSTIVAVVVLYGWWVGVARVAGSPVGSPRDPFGDLCIETIWKLMPSDAIASMQNTLGCCGWTYFNPTNTLEEEDSFGRKRKRGNKLPSEAGADVPCPATRSAMSCAPLADSSTASTDGLGVNSSFTLTQIPASCRAELKCHLGGVDWDAEAKEAAPWVNHYGIPTWNTTSPLFVCITLIVVFEALAVATLVFATRNVEGDPEFDDVDDAEDTGHDDDAAFILEKVVATYNLSGPILHGATSRLQRNWRGWIERRRRFQQRFYTRWERLTRLRNCVSFGVYFACVLWSSAMLYVCLLYGVKFSPEQANLWITSSMWALALEMAFQEPLMIILGEVVCSDRGVSRVGDELTALCGI